MAELVLVVGTEDVEDGGAEVDVDAAVVSGPDVGVQGGGDSVVELPGWVPVVSVDGTAVVIEADVTVEADVRVEAEVAVGADVAVEAAAGVDVTSKIVATVESSDSRAEFPLPDPHAATKRARSPAAVHRTAPVQFMGQASIDFVSDGRVLRPSSAIFAKNVMEVGGTLASNCFTGSTLN